jgi:hypothetical protein
MVGRLQFYGLSGHLGVSWSERSNIYELECIDVSLYLSVNIVFHEIGPYSRRTTEPIFSTTWL